MERILDAQAVEKKFGFFYALKRISLSLNSPALVGIIGPNGSGKTTLLKICATLLPPSSGQVYVLGKDARKAGEKIRREVSVLLHNPGFYEELTAKENLALAYRLLRGNPDTKWVKMALEWAGLEKWADFPVRSFSRGMKQKLALARSLFLPANLYLLDEPFTALDDEGMEKTHQRFQALIAQNKTIVFSAHRWTPTSDIPIQLFQLQAGILTPQTL